MSAMPSAPFSPLVARAGRDAKARPRLRKARRATYICFMTRILPILLLLALPALAQEPAPDTAAEPEAGAPAAEGLPPEEGETAIPDDPVAAWEADPTGILPAEGVELSDFEYLARPLVVFADSPRQPQVEEQLRLIRADLEALAIRDVVIILDTDPEAGTELRRELRPRGFGLVLVDKDGRVTLRRPAPLSVRDITRAIDRTPLRQEELRLGRAVEAE
jgi:hypothetical protein